VPSLGVMPGGEAAIRQKRPKLDRKDFRGSDESMGENGRRWSVKEEGISDGAQSVVARRQPKA
jgi:hypothetical protein